MISSKSEALKTPKLKTTKRKWVHKEINEPDVNLVTPKNYEEVPTLKTWGYLDFLKGGDLIPLISDRRIYILGRSPSADIQLENEEYISPEHIKIELRVSNPSWPGDLKVTIEDLGSENGTLKNSLPLSTEPEALLHQDVIDVVSFDYSKLKDCKPIRFQFLKTECRSMHKDYQLLGEVGSGGSASVKKARSCATGAIRAIKLLPKLQSGDLLRDSLQRREVALMKRLSHPFVTELIDIIESRQEIGLVIPLAPCGDLEKFCKGRTLKNSELVQIYYQVLNGLSYLHNNGLIHRDIKPKNTLVFSQAPLIVKISDFGTTKIYKPLKPPSTRVGTPYYVAPEIGDNGNNISYTPKCDLFSVGIMFFKSVTSKLLFSEPKNRVNNLQVDSVITKNSRLFAKKEKKLLCSLLVLDPTKRLSADEALELPFFTENQSTLYFQKQYETQFKAKPNTFPYSQKHPLQEDDQNQSI